MQIPEDVIQKKKQERAALNYPFAEHEPACSDRETVQVTEVARDVFWLRLPMPMALDHINIYLLKDTDGWYIIDTGLNNPGTQAIWQQVAEQIFAGEPVKGVICTHFHYDHASLARWLMTTFDAPLYMTRNEYLMTRAMAGNREEIGSERQQAFYRRCGMPAPLIEKMLNACRNDPFMDHYPPEYIRIREGDHFIISGRRWQILTGSGHSPEHACLHCLDENLLIAGDQLLPEISSNILVADMEPEANPLQDWLQSLSKLSELAQSTQVMPAHGPVFRQMHTRIRQLREHHQDQLYLLRQLAKKQPGFTAYQALQALFNRPLGPVDRMLAQGETLAHLNYLRFQGYLERYTSPADASDPVQRYRIKTLPEEYALQPKKPLSVSTLQELQDIR